MTNINTTKRWAVLRKASGKLVKAFNSREDARDYKRYTNGNFMLFDTANGLVVR